MNNLENLAALADKLESPLKENAASLVVRMGEVVEGIGDTPIHWRPDNLRLVQATSDTSKLPSDARIGSIVVGEDVIPQPFKVIPLKLHHTRQYWDPNPDNAQILCSSQDAKYGSRYGECRQCPYAVFDETTNKSQCNKTITVLTIDDQLKNLFFINFSKTNYRNGMDWEGLMRQAKTSPFKRTYSITSEVSKTSKNARVLKAEPITGVKNEGALLDFLEELYNRAVSDRTEMLDRFYEYVKSRTAAAALAAPSQPAALISDQTDSVVEDAITVVESAPVSPAAEKASKRYSL